MRRYLVVAHRTLGGRHLLEHLDALCEEGPCRFHLVVPEERTRGLVWSESEVWAAARRRLQEGLDRLHGSGMTAEGEVGDADPVYAVGVVLRREGPSAFDGIVLSTLPLGVSRWARLDVPTRIRKEHPHVPMVHLVAEREPAGA